MMVLLVIKVIVVVPVTPQTPHSLATNPWPLLHLGTFNGPKDERLSALS